MRFYWRLRRKFLPFPVLFVVSTRCLFHSLYEELVELEIKISSADQRIERALQENAEYQRIGAVEGIGPVTATAVVAASSDGHAFRNGRQFAAWVGLYRDSTPAEAKQNCRESPNAAIPYLRTLLVHGARSVVYRATAKSDSRSRHKLRRDQAHCMPQPA